MKDGFIKVAAATPSLRVADCIYNGQQLQKVAQEAYEQGVKLLVTPELGITGYTCGDLFLQQKLLESAKEALMDVCAQTAGMDMLLVVGLPYAHLGKLYNCAAVLHRGRVLGLVPKTNLPNYGEFYERRQFEPAFLGCSNIALQNREDIPFGANILFACKSVPEFVLGVEICEDLWAPVPPSSGLALAGATVVANLSASNEVIGKQAYRQELVRGQSARLVCGYVYANAGQGESTTDAVFAGHNMVAENGTMLAESPLFSEQMLVTEIDVQRLHHERRRLTTYPQGVDKNAGYTTAAFDMECVETSLARRVSATPFIPADTGVLDDRCETVLSIQAAGLAKRIKHVGAQKLILGLSGGLDSSLALLVAARALRMLGRPAKDILAVTMPAFGTTSRTKANAQTLANAVGASFESIDIAQSVRQHFKDIGQDERVQDVVYENSQARMRTMVLMDMANKVNGLVVGTGDLSELALGWATYNGDHMSMYAVNASVPKTMIRYIVAHEAAREPDLKNVLEDILNTPVSPELLPAENGEISQQTEEIVGPYELHDFTLYYTVRWGFGPVKVYRLAQRAFDGQYSGKTILKWMKEFYRRFFTQQFKRSCLPDGPKVGSVSLSPRGDWRMPSDASAAIWLAQLDALEKN